MSNTERPWQWVECEIPIVSPKILAEMAKHAGVTIEEMRAAAESVQSGEKVWKDRTYQVNVRPLIPTGEPKGPPFAHFSIKRIDRAAVGVERFRHFQRIKNDLAGPECEAIELYPSETRLVDTSNQYHLFVCMDPGYRWPFGFNDRLVFRDSGGGAVQRPFEDDEL